MSGGGASPASTEFVDRVRKPPHLFRVVADVEHRQPTSSRTHSGYGISSSRRAWSSADSGSSDSRIAGCDSSACPFRRHGDGTVATTALPS